MKQTDRKRIRKEAVASLQLVVPLAEMVRKELRAFVIAQGMQALGQMLEEDRQALCGPAYARGLDVGPKRAGSATGELSAWSIYLRGDRRILSRFVEGT